MLIIDETLGFNLNSLNLFLLAITSLEIKNVEIFHVALIISAHETQVLIISMKVKSILKFIVVDVICVL